MNTDQKKKLYHDAGIACRALGKIIDGPHDLKLISRFDVKKLCDEIRGAMAGLSVLAAKLEAEIGTDNL